MHGWNANDSEEKACPYVKENPAKFGHHKCHKAFLLEIYMIFIFHIDQ